MKAGITRPGVYRVHNLEVGTSPIVVVTRGNDGSLWFRINRPTPRYRVSDIVVPYRAELIRPLADDQR